ncbi:dual specificity protein catalytic domain-containing [Plasmopara halstedii]|uniref:protein-tyrosine-phosphatase n=1 Tax=Plasmopara halstedii TaxID=4781 RepID=A0A0P1B2M1_PLAHL|nr:dual specificity protein catalytic domain-containing [Plasmopara halstedii]CEG48077.1 dual specificity protein catalytic domain-containing [Plasmopara halstedii]|eukprot:XP_024584446.1 dual specificity protein catalytic domain-containing [Plasmopara halstedii]
MTREIEAEPSRILEHIYLGSRAHARDKNLLQRLHITHILNVTPQKEMDPVAGVPNFFEKDKTFIYQRCSIFDNKAQDLSSVLDSSITFIEQAKYYGRILVHCNKGVSRSTSMILAYLIKYQTMTFDQALTFVIERHPIANPNANFRQQLHEFECQVHRQASSKKRSRALCNANEKKDSVKFIGPQLPYTSNTDDNRTTKQLKTENKVIGPSLPPSSES